MSMERHLKVLKGKNVILELLWPIKLSLTNESKIKILKRGIKFIVITLILKQILRGVPQVEIIK